MAVQQQGQPRVCARLKRRVVQLSALKRHLCAHPVTSFSPPLASHTTLRFCSHLQFLDAARRLGGSDAQQPPCLHLNMVFEGGLGSIVVEVQIHLFSIMEVKKESHQLYEVERASSMQALA